MAHTETKMFMEVSLPTKGLGWFGVVFSFFPGRIGEPIGVILLLLGLEIMRVAS